VPKQIRVIADTLGNPTAPLKAFFARNINISKDFEQLTGSDTDKRRTKASFLENLQKTRNFAPLGQLIVASPVHLSNTKEVA
jgi:hypothetical protein